jgi:site-specific DNA recombinase
LPCSRLSDGQLMDDRALVAASLEKVIVGKGNLTVLLTPEGDEGREPKVIGIDWSPQPNARKRAVIRADHQTPRPMRSEARSRLLVALVKARQWLAEMISNPDITLQVVAAREGCSERSAPMSLNLAFLSPEIVRAVIDGTLVRGMGMSAMMDLPSSWIDQAKAVTASVNRY